MKIQNSKFETGRLVDSLISLLSASASIALAALSIASYRSDQAFRRRTENFFSVFTLDKRRPLDFESVKLAPSGDWTAAIAAVAALSDATQSVSLSKLSPELKALWLENAAQVSEELKTSVDLLADAIAVRPGWGFYRYLLGELEYTRLNRAQDVDLALRPEKWRAPLRLAAAAVPGDDAIWTFLAGADLETWQVVKPEARPDADFVLHRAFLDPSFVARSLPAAIALMGRSRVLALVPDEVGPLQSAFSMAARERDVDGAAGLLGRIDQAERRARAEDMRKIEERVRLGDRDGVLETCRDWVSRHQIRGFDDPAGRKEVARLLEVWPVDAVGSWGRDPRTGLVLYALTWRESEVSASVLERIVESLSDVPAPVVARVQLRAGDSRGAAETLRQSPTAGSFEWTPYYLDLARQELRRGAIESAREAIAKIAPAAREECESLRVARDVARAAKNDDALSNLERNLTAATGLSDSKGEVVGIEPEVWSASGALTLCLDPERTRKKSLIVTLRSRSTGAGTTSPPTLAPPRLRGGVADDGRSGAGASSSLVTYGWDDARNGTTVLKGDARLTIPFGELAGRHSFSYRVLVGAPVDPVATEIR